MSAPFDQVTEAQRICLRLVLSHHNSKEIAQIVGVSPSAVDKRLERAVQILGASSRFAAARMLDLHESEADEKGDQPTRSPTPPHFAGVTDAGDAETSDWLPSEPIDISDEHTAAIARPSSLPWGLARRIVGVAPTVRNALGSRNELSKTERLLLIGMLILVVSVSAVALLNMGQTLSSMIGKARTSMSQHEHLAPPR